MNEYITLVALVAYLGLILVMALSSNGQDAALSRQ